MDLYVVSTKSDQSANNPECSGKYTRLLLERVLPPFMLACTIVNYFKELLFPFLAYGSLPGRSTEYSDAHSFVRATGGQIFMGRLNGNGTASY